MNLGICSVCGNKSEIHLRRTGAYCEDCLPENNQNVPESVPEGGKFSAPIREESKRDEYLRYIISRATEEWIDKFLLEWRNEMKRSLGWIGELRRIEDDLKLLRIAAELGYGKKAQYKPSLNYDAIQKSAQTEDSNDDKPKDTKRKSKKGTGGAKKKKKR